MAPRAGQNRRKVYEFVRERILEGRPPTVREVARAMGFSAVQSAAQHLEALVAEGLLDKEPGRSRGYRLPEVMGRNLPTRFVPVVGRVQAGALATALEDPEGYLPVQSRTEASGLFALRVRGLSMRDAGILPGDLVIVRRQPDAEDGDVVVALVDDEATVKRLRRRARHVELVPDNPDFPVLTLGAGQFSILGKVIEVRRHLETTTLYDDPLDRS